MSQFAIYTAPTTPTKFSNTPTRQRINSLADSTHRPTNPSTHQPNLPSGGFRGQYAGGVLSILQLLEQRGLINIKRWAGSSIGACTAAHFASGNDFESFFKVRRFASVACGVASSLHCTLSPSMGPARPP